MAKQSNYFFYGQQYWILPIVLLLIGVYVAGMFPEVSIDAGKYAGVTRHMFEGGDWIHLKVYGQPYMQKPLLFFWLSTLSFKVFGMSMWALKLPTLLFSFWGIFCLYRFGKEFYGKTIGFWSALVYATSEMMFLYNNDLHIDALLTSNIIFATWQLALFIKNGTPVNLALGFVGCGLAMISKGPIGLAVPIIGVVSHIIAKRKWSLIWSTWWLLGILILAIILAPTLIGVFHDFGWQGIQFFFWTNNAGRISGQYAGGNSDLLYYLHTLIYIFLPWSFFAFLAMVWQAQYIWVSKHRQRPEYLSFGIVIFYTLILSVAQQKAPHYSFPVIPFLSIIVVDFVRKVTLNKGLVRWKTTLNLLRSSMLILTLALLFVIIGYIFPLPKNYLWVAAIVILFFIMLSLRKNNKLAELMLPLIATGIVLNVFVNLWFYPEVLKYHGVIQASYRFNQKASNQASLVTYNYGQFETYYYPKIPSAFATDINELDSLLSMQSTWIVTDREGFCQIKRQGGLIFTYLEEFPFQKASNFRWEFLNPSTRASALDTVYLMKVEQYLSHDR